MGVVRQFDGHQVAQQVLSNGERRVWNRRSGRDQIPEAAYCWPTSASTIWPENFVEARSR
jgi:hypothetical protein